jgi:hypothetical protein
VTKVIDPNMTDLAKAKNFRGDWFAIIKNRTAKVGPNKTLTYTPSFMVCKLCSNYDSKVKGGVRKTWRYIKNGKDLTIDAARALFFLKTGRNPNETCQ